MAFLLLLSDASGKVVSQEFGIPDQLHRVIADVNDGVFRVPFSDFQIFALERVRELVPFDSAVWLNGVNDTHQLHSSVLINQEPDLIVRYVRDHAQTDLIRGKALAEPGTAFRIEDVIPLEAYWQHPTYLNFWKTVQIEQAMAVAALDPVSSLYELIVLWRADRARPFSDGMRQLAQDIASHVMAAWRHRQIVHLYEQAMAGPNSHQFRLRGQAIVDRSGALFASDTHFNATLQDHFDGWTGSVLPPEVQNMILSDTQKASIGGVDFLLTPGAVRSLLAVSVSQNAQLLSEAELRVARLYASGQTNAQIAGALGVTRSTVRNQIANAYHKLDLHSKVELAKRLDQSAASSSGSTATVV